SGQHSAEVKAFEARESVARGADEVDMVLNVGLARAGEYDAVEHEIRAVRDVAKAPVVLKVIIESAALTDEQIVAVCEAAERAGADFVKTSTGFHPAGGASEHAVALMRRTVGDRLGVKASGGIRTREAAEAVVAAGASRLGLSSSRAILEGARRLSPRRALRAARPPATPGAYRRCGGSVRSARRSRRRGAA